MTIVLGPDTLAGVPRVQPPMHPYAQIAAYYRRQISRGVLKPGEVFPPLSAIGAKWGVSRATAQRAIAELRDEGLLIAERGRGTVVAGPPP